MPGGYLGENIFYSKMKQSGVGNRFADLNDVQQVGPPHGRGTVKQLCTIAFVAKVVVGGFVL